MSDKPKRLATVLRKVAARAPSGRLSREEREQLRKIDARLAARKRKR